MNASKINPPPGMAECLECDMGFNGQDEDGRYYSCYACCETGWMPAQAVADYWRDRAWQVYVAAEARIVERAKLGVPPGWSYYYDEWTGEMVMKPPRDYKPSVAVEDYDDIPF